MIVRPTLSWSKIGAYVGRPLGAYTLLAVAVSVAHAYSGAVWLSMPALPVTILAATLGILLSFRNNSGYDRWWEARTLWGGVVNASRTFARQLLTLLPHDDASWLGDGGNGAARALRASRLQQSALDDDGAPAAWTRTRATDGAVRDRHGAAVATAP
jgi:putative membrane protein